MIFFFAYCRNNLCTLQSFTASCQKRLPAAMVPVTTAVAQMKTPQGHDEGEDDHSPCSGVHIWECSCLRHPLSFPSSHWSHDGAWSWSLWWVYLSYFCLLCENPHPISSHQRTWQAVVSTVWQEVGEKKSPVMWNRSESLTVSSVLFLNSESIFSGLVHLYSHFFVA